MKKILTIFLILIVATLTAYFMLDRQLYYYGKSNFNFYGSLPLKIQPQYWGYDKGNLGFVLVDQYEMTIISKGEFQYVGSPLIIDVQKIIKYGFTNEKLLVLVKDNQNNNYFIRCKKNDDVSSMQNMSIKILAGNTSVNDDEYTWIELDNNYVRKIEITRGCLRIIAILLFCGIAYSKFKLGGVPQREIDT